MTLEFTVPIRTGRGQNDRDAHWRVRHQRVEREREATALCFRAARKGQAVALPVLVTLTRISPGRPLDSHDNLRASLKACVDQIADELGVNDGDRARIRFAYGEQERGPWGVRVRVEEIAPGDVDQYEKAPAKTGESAESTPKKTESISTKPITPRRRVRGFKVTPAFYRGERNQ